MAPPLWDTPFRRPVQARAVILITRAELTRRTDRSGEISAEFDGAQLHVQRVHDEQPAAQWRAHTHQHLECLGGLHAANDPD